MLRTRVFAAMVLLCAVSAAHGQNRIQNGLFENWTGANPDNWAPVSTLVPSKASGLDGTGFAVNLGLSSANNSSGLTQILQQPLTGSFFVQFDFAYAAGTTGDRTMDVTLKSTTAASILHPRVSSGGVVEFYGSATGTDPRAWHALPGTAGQMFASNFSTGTVVVYRMIIQGTWLGEYTVSLKNLTTNTDLAVNVPMSMWQEPSASFAELRLERGRSRADWRADNVMVYAQDPRKPNVSAGANQQVTAPDNTVQMNPSVFDIDTAPEDLTYAWTQISGPAASFSSNAGETAGDLQAVIILDGGPGLYEFKLTVSDPDGNVGAATVLVRSKDAGDDALLGHWAFEDQPQGSIAVDTLDPLLGNIAADDGVVGLINPLVGDPNSDPNWVEGWAGDAALEFYGNGLVDIQVDKTADPNLTGLQWEISTAAWVKPDAATLSNPYNTIIARANPFNWVLRQLANGRVEFTLALEGSGNLFTAGTVNVVDGYWHHVAGTYDGKEVRIYVDGILDVSRPATGFLQFHPEAELTIAGRHGQGHAWRGALDDVRVYSYALSPEEVQDLTRLGKNVKPWVAIDDTIATEIIIAFQDSVDLTAQVLDWNTDQGQIVTSEWSVPDASLADKVVFDDAASVNTTATFLEPGIYTLRITVMDEFGAGIEGDIHDEITIIVKDAICRDLLVVDPRSGLLVNPALSLDISGPTGEPDCYVNLHDLAVMAQQWMLCNDPQGEGCQPIVR
ncbi:MAG: hypothetical protein IH624_01495 [Phycisphaerae bacterium]|nr:hypothetical protein [Phycisphaerae bacterium]